MTDEEFDTEYQRVLTEYVEATDAAYGGAFFLLYDTAPEWPGYPVVNEPDFEVEFRTRMDSNTHPDATLVFLPWKS
jgi:hypothetical protein